jgi:hypothetical protein
MHVFTMCMARHSSNNTLAWQLLVCVDRGPACLLDVTAVSNITWSHTHCRLWPGLASQHPHAHTGAMPWSCHSSCSAVA